MNVHEQLGDKMAAGKHLSLLHAMMASIQVQTDAKRLNAILNHAEVLPWVSMDGEAIDVSEAVARDDVVALLGTYGGVTFHRLQPGLWEAHTKMLPEGRGQWALACVQACLHFLFCRTEAVEIMTRCPQGNVAAKTLARSIHGQFEFINPIGWIRDGLPVPADIYRLTIQDWIRHAPGLVERGQWFRETQVTQSEAAVDVELDRRTGLAWEMSDGGQRQKAAIFYNRWAMMAGYPPLGLPPSH